MTKAESAFQSSVRDLGCIACIVTGVRGTPCDIHHMLDGGRRIGEMDVLGLCPTHHRGGFCGHEFVSRHPYRVAFEKPYRTEQELLALTHRLIARRVRA